VPTPAATRSSCCVLCAKHRYSPQRGPRRLLECHQLPASHSQDNCGPAELRGVDRKIIHERRRAEVRGFNAGQVSMGKYLTHGTERLFKDLTLPYLRNVPRGVLQEAPKTVNAMMQA
jgi:hypothetical protein